MVPQIHIKAYVEKDIFLGDSSASYKVQARDSIGPSRGGYILVGQCYVHDMMSGEVMEEAKMVHLGKR